MTSILGNTRRPDIAFHSSGRIDITSRVVKALKLKEGDCIDIMIVGREYYLFVASRAATGSGRHEAQCYPSKRGSNHFRAWCLRLCSAILDYSGFSHHASFAAGDPIIINDREAIPIITRRNLSNNSNPSNPSNNHRLQHPS